jgi:hypothetical protein
MTTEWTRTAVGGWTRMLDDHRLNVSPYRRGSGRGFAYVARVDGSALSSPPVAHATLPAAKAEAERAVRDYRLATEDGLDDEVVALLRRRETAQSFKRLERAFAAVPQDLLLASLDRLSLAGRIRVCRNGLSRRAGYVYEAL